VESNHPFIRLALKKFCVDLSCEGFWIYLGYVD